MGLASRENQGLRSRVNWDKKATNYNKAKVIPGFGINCQNRDENIGFDVTLSVDPSTVKPFNQGIWKVVQLVTLWRMVITRWQGEIPTVNALPNGDHPG